MHSIPLHCFCYKPSSPGMTTSWPSSFHGLILLLWVCVPYFLTQSSHFTPHVLPGGQVLLVVTTGWARVFFLMRTAIFSTSAEDALDALVLPLILFSQTFCCFWSFHNVYIAVASSPRVILTVLKYSQKVEMSTMSIVVAPVLFV